MLVWAAPVYHKKEGATLYPGVWKFSLQYDGRLAVRVVRSNLGSLGGKGGDVCKELRKRMIDECCLQEVRWRGHDAGDERKKI